MLIFLAFLQVVLLFYIAYRLEKLVRADQAARLTQLLLDRLDQR